MGDKQAVKKREKPQEAVKLAYDMKTLMRIAEPPKERSLDGESQKRLEKYSRGKIVNVKHVSDKRLKGQLKHKEKLYGEASASAASVEKWLLPSDSGALVPEGIERTHNFQQAAIAAEVPLLASRHAFDLRLPDLGPYSVGYSRNGRSLLLGGRKGHLAIVDWRKNAVTTELQVKETIRDVCFLHNEQFFAAAQKKHTYIYDKRGIEIHRLKNHTDPLRIQFLHHHFLLASISKSGALTYTDTTNGGQAAQHRVRNGRACPAFAANPANGVLFLGQSNGTVTLWSPNMPTPLASILCHQGPLTSLCLDASGRQLVTAGMDRKLSVWDVRKFVPLRSYACSAPVKSLSASQKGLLALGIGSGVQIWKDAIGLGTWQPQEEPAVGAARGSSNSTASRGVYLKHRVFEAAEVDSLAFCPYEDVLGVGHAQGFSSLIVPGAGEPNFDTFVANPFETASQRREGEVQALLDKLPPETIMLDVEEIGKVRKKDEERSAEVGKLGKEANSIAAKKLKKRKKGEDVEEEEEETEEKEKNKMKGKNKPSKKYRKKMDNIIDEKRQKMREEERYKEEERRREAKAEKVKEEGGGGEDVPYALSRFVRK